LIYNYDYLKVERWKEVQNLMDLELARQNWKLEG